MSRISTLANNITTSPILTFAAKVNAKIAEGEKIYNLTVGDFNPHIYPIPTELKQDIIKAYDNNETNYPGAFGLTPLREAVRDLLKKYNNIDLDINDILIASGSRPLIYATYKTIIDKGDKVLFPVPSWNNDYYTTLTDGQAIMIETTPENNFMPTKDELLPHIGNATLLALCSPQNPTGTVLSKQQLIDICEVVVAENNRRSADEKPLYVMFDQVYWLMAFGDDVFNHALNINPQMQEYAIFIDGVSKSFAGTGVRVGWATGPSDIIAKMRSFVAHIGAWAPRAEQVACGAYLSQLDKVDEFITGFNTTLQTVLTNLYNGFMQMKNEGLAVDSIKPEASIYLSIKLDILGTTTTSGKTLETVDDVQEFLLNDAKVAVLPFAWFGAKNSDNWYRISIGVCPADATDEIINNIKTALNTLK
jgi:aspartate aminotransferase